MIKRVSIVGGGASGVLLAAHLLRYSSAPLVVTLIERRSELGAGIAYSTDHPEHLLNVRASNMSAYADDPEHFVRWLRDRVPRDGRELVDPSYFAPRRLYRDYLASLLYPHFESGRLRRAKAEVTGVCEEEAYLRVDFSDGTSRAAELVILATGNEAPTLPPAPWRFDGWNSSPRPQIRADAPVLMVGTGLTMVDWVVTLLDDNHRGPITAVSPHGLAPHVHRLTKQLPIDQEEVPFGARLSEISSWLRRRTRQAEAAGGDWRSVIDGVRPYIQRIWHDMTPADRRRFLRLGRPWWDQHRHRIAPDAAAKLQAARQRGQLRIAAAQVLGFEPRESGVDVLVAHTAKQATERIHAEAVFECRGRASDVRKSENPILRTLLARGKARPDSLNLGLDVTQNCALIDKGGHPSKRIYAIGPLTSGVFWEITAVPDIRVQVGRLADHLRVSAP